MTLLFVSGVHNSLVSCHTILIRAHIDLTDDITHDTPDRSEIFLTESSQRPDERDDDCHYRPSVC